MHALCEDILIVLKKMGVIRTDAPKKIYEVKIATIAGIQHNRRVAAVFYFPNWV